MIAKVSGTVVGIRGILTKQGKNYTEIELLQPGNGGGGPSEVVRVRTADMAVVKRFESGKPAVLDVKIAEREWQGRRFMTCDLIG